MLIRLANIADLPAIMDIVRSAQSALRELGIDQWQDGYPTPDIISEDITQGVGYVACFQNGDIVGYEAIVLTGEAAYKQLPDDAWHTPQEYVVVHRLCVLRDYTRMGVAKKLMAFAVQHAIENDIYAFRIDTHKGNVRMMTLLPQLGFKHVGVVRYDSGEREAFDMKLSNK